PSRGAFGALFDRSSPRLGVLDCFADEVADFALADGFAVALALKMLRDRKDLPGIGRSTGFARVDRGGVELFSGISSGGFHRVVSPVRRCWKVSCLRRIRSTWL